MHDEIISIVGDPQGFSFIFTSNIARQENKFQHFLIKTVAPKKLSYNFIILMTNPVNINQNKKNYWPYPCSRFCIVYM